MPDSSTRADGRSASQLRPLRFQNRHRALRHRLHAHRMGQHARHLRRDRRGIRAALDEGAKGRGRLDHGGILHAPLLHLDAQTARHLQGQARRALVGNPAAHRPLHARGAGPGKNRRAHHLRGLRRVAGGRRHAHGGHHRRVRRAVARGEEIDRREEIVGKPDSSRRRRRERRHRERRAAAGFVLHRGRGRGGGHESGDE